MRQWIRQLLPWLLVLSVGANIWLGYQIWERDRIANWITWGNTMSAFAQQINQASGEAEGPQYYAGVSTGAYMAEEMLDQFTWLPHARERTDFDSMQVVRRFLQYARNSHYLAYQEQQEQGSVSEESRQRMAKVKEGMELILRQAERKNILQADSFTWRHEEWRRIWTNMAEGLNRIDFVPLPQQ